jgi:hypothetical protein
MTGNNLTAVSMPNYHVGRLRILEKAKELNTQPFPLLLQFLPQLLHNQLPTLTCNNLNIPDTKR